MTDAAPTTDIQAGDVFLFRGLTNEAGGGEGRMLTILGISTGGKVSFRIDMADDDDLKGPSIDSIQYSEALVMIEQGIWKPYQEARSG